MAWTTNTRVMHLRRRSGTVDLVVATLDGYRRHQTGRNGAVLTYYGFVTLFPLFLAATTVLGFVLENRPQWRQDLIGSAVESVPFIGERLATTGSIGRSYWALTIGLGAAVWGSMKAFVGLQGAFDDIWEIPVDDRANLVRRRLRALIGLAAIGGSQVGNVVLAALVSEADLTHLGRAALVIGGLAINAAVLSTMYRFLTSADTTWRVVWPGTAFAAAVYTAIQFAGTAITARLLEGAETYGDFASILALLGWLSLHAEVNLLGAELNAASAARRAVTRAG